MVEFENKDAKIHPIGKAHPPKRRFLPSKWERMHVKKLVALLREGKIKPPPPPAPEVWDLWADDPPSKRRGRGPCLHRKQRSLGMRPPITRPKSFSSTRRRRRLGRTP